MRRDTANGRLLSWKREIRVTGTASSSAEALRLADQRRPHACLISATLGQGEALTLASRLKRFIDPPCVLIFADAVDQHLACAARVAGADGVLGRYADPEEQVAVIRRAASGKQQFPELQPSAIHALLDQVEDRDRAIVAMLLEHTHPDHIAGLLGLSARSLELRRQDILKRLGPTCGVDDCRQDEREHRSPVPTDDSRDTNPADEKGAPCAQEPFDSSIMRCRHHAHFARGARPPDQPDGEHAEPAVLPSHPGTDKHRQRRLAGAARLPGRDISQAADDVAAVPAHEVCVGVVRDRDPCLLGIGLLVSRRSASPSRCGEAPSPVARGDPHRLFVSSPTRVAGVRHRPMAFSSRRSSLA